jgi:hypothetical protein
MQPHTKHECVEALLARIDHTDFNRVREYARQKDNGDDRPSRGDRDLFQSMRIGAAIVAARVTGDWVRCGAVERVGGRGENWTCRQVRRFAMSGQKETPATAATDAGAQEERDGSKNTTTSTTAQLNPGLFHDPGLAGAARALQAAGVPDDVARAALLELRPATIIKRLSTAEDAEMDPGMIEHYLGLPEHEEPVGGESGNSVNSVSTSQEADWEPPIPFDTPSHLPAFPLEALPPSIRGFVEEVSASRQVPPDLPAVLALGVVAAAGAGRFRVKIGETHSEPLNLFATVVLPPGSRKSDTFRDVTLPLEEHERELALEAAPKISQAKERRAVEEGRLKSLRERAAKVEDPAERNALAQEAVELAANLTPVPPEPRLIAGDVTPERLANLLHEQGGRLAIMDAESGGVFDVMAGRYTRDGSANLDVYLRGHAGDAIRVDRVGRPSEFVKSPALTMVLTPQPDVIRSLADRPGFRGRGLLGRFLYSIPESRVGTRRYQNRPVSEVEARQYHRTIRAILDLPSPDPSDPSAFFGLKIEGQALNIWAEYADAVEVAQADGGELAGVRDWASKLAGAVARIAGGLHLVEYGHGTPWTVSISPETVAAAWAVGDYFEAHALAAFSMMGADPEVERAQTLLRWIERHGIERFTLRDCYQDNRRQASSPSDFLPALDVLEARGFIRRLPDPERPGPGRKPSPAWEVNPANRTQNSHNWVQGADSVNSVNSVYNIREGGAA